MTCVPHTVRCVSIVRDSCEHAHAHAHVNMTCDMCMHMLHVHVHAHVLYASYRAADGWKYVRLSKKNHFAMSHRTMGVLCNCNHVSRHRVFLSRHARHSTCFTLCLYVPLCLTYGSLCSASIPALR